MLSERGFDRSDVALTRSHFGGLDEGGVDVSAGGLQNRSLKDAFDTEVYGVRPDSMLGLE
jgi:hypothetical protein